VGDEVVVEGVRLQVLAVEGHRITRLRAMSVTDKTYEGAADADKQTLNGMTVMDGRENEQPGQEKEK
jgi:hypothetical protein